MSTIQKILILSCLSLIAPSAVVAQSLNELQALSPEDRRAYFESMSEDERTAMSGKWRTEFDSLPDEQKQAIRDQRAREFGGRSRNRDRAAMQDRWETMSEQERVVARERRQEMKQRRNERWESMSEDERAAAREHFRGQKEKGGGRRQHDGADPGEQPPS
jgi:hypothetical protein